MDRSYVDGLLLAKDFAKKMADEHQATAEEAFERLKKDFYPIPYSEHTEQQREERRVLQNVNNIECSKAIVLYELINKLWDEIFKADKKEAV